MKRREFLRLYGLISAAAWLEACVPKPLKPTSIAKTLLVPAATDIQVASPTPETKILPRTWASDENGLVDPERMFPFVGSIAYPVLISRMVPN